MKPTFTPGPWHVGSQTGHNANTIYAYGDSPINNTSIATVYSIWSNAHIDDCQDCGGLANAHLIAASPELLEALEMALEWIDAVPSDVAASFPVMPGFDRDWVNELVAKARGAITRRISRGEMNQTCRVCGHKAIDHARKGKLYPAYIHTGQCSECDCVGFRLDWNKELP